MAKPSILVVDDEASIRRTLREILEYEDWHVDEAEDGETAIAKARAGVFDVTLLDIKMPRMDGMEVLTILTEEVPELPVIMISGHADIKTAVEATHAGAFHFIEKPPDLHQLLATVRAAMDRGRLVQDNRRMRQTIEERRTHDLVPILGNSPAIEAVKKTIKRVAPTSARVLITGEPGTGKELVAKWIHEGSARRGGPMVAVNCAAIPGELIESELFGHEKGSFTGASKQRLGKFEQADGGTLFLDEVGDMSLPAQAKVLRALQENKVSRVGGDREIHVDVRVVAATNHDLGAAIGDGTFREDLYHRLSVILVHLPPVRERKGDVSLLVEHFLRQMARRHGAHDRTISPDALKHLETLPWRGNVRELQNVVERLVILSAGNLISRQDVERYVTTGFGDDDSVVALIHRHQEFSAYREAAERAFLQQKLEEFEWNVSRTAASIGVQRSHLYSKMKKLSIARGS